MNLNDMTDNQKSVMLAKLMGWKVANIPLKEAYKRVIVDANGNDLGLTPVGGGVKPVEVEISSLKINLYEPRHMALAWRVLNWAKANYTKLHMSVTKEHSIAWIFAYEPDGQRIALDKILELAIEAGLITAEKEQL